MAGWLGAQPGPQGRRQGGWVGGAEEGAAALGPGSGPPAVSHEPLIINRLMNILVIYLPNKAINCRIMQSISQIIQCLQIMNKFRGASQPASQPMSGLCDVQFTIYDFYSRVFASRRKCAVSWSSRDRGSDRRLSPRTGVHITLIIGAFGYYNSPAVPPHRLLPITYHIHLLLTICYLLFNTYDTY